MLTMEEQTYILKALQMLKKKNPEDPAAKDLKEYLNKHTTVEPAVRTQNYTCERSVPTVSETLQNAVEAYQKFEPFINEEKTDTEIKDAFAEAEEFWKGLDLNKIQPSKDNAVKTPESENYRYQIFTKSSFGEPRHILNLNTKEQIVVGQTLFFGDELLKLYKKEEFFGQHFEVMDIRSVFDIEKFPNIRGRDDFRNKEVLVKAKK